MGEIIKLIAARHGETKSNAESIIQGRMDEPLTEKGERQAVELAGKLPLNEIAIIFCSPLIRAVQTAEIVCQRAGNKIPIIRTENLYERDFGKLSGTTWEKLKQQQGAEQLSALWKADRETLTYDYRPYGGESAEQVEFRVKFSLLEAKDFLIDGQTGLFVASAGIIRHLDKLYYGTVPEVVGNASFQSYTLPNANIDTVKRPWDPDGRYAQGFLREYQHWVLEVSWRQHTLGRLVIVAKRQSHTFSDLTADEKTELKLVMAQARIALLKCERLHPDHFNYLLQDKSTKHLQLHIVPTYSGKRWFYDQWWGDRTFKEKNINTDLVLEIRETLNPFLI